MCSDDYTCVCIPIEKSFQKVTVKVSFNIAFNCFAFPSSKLNILSAAAFKMLPFVSSQSTLKGLPIWISQAKPQKHTINNPDFLRLDFAEEICYLVFGIWEHVLDSWRKVLAIGSMFEIKGHSFGIWQHVCHILCIREANMGKGGPFLKCVASI